MFSERFEELKRLERHYGDNEEAIIQLLHALAEMARERKAEFIKALTRMPISPGNWNAWEEIIAEVLPESYCEDPVLQDFLLDELERFLALVEENPNDDDVEDCINHVADIGNITEGSLNQRVKERLLRGLDHPDASVRRICVDAVAILLDESCHEELTKLERMLESDLDWRVRYAAHLILVKEWSVESAKGKLSTWDRLRAKIESVQ